MSEQKKEAAKNLWFALRRNQAKNSLSTVYKAKKKTFVEKELFLRKRENGGLNRKQKEGFFNCSR